MKKNKIIGLMCIIIAVYILLTQIGVIKTINIFPMLWTLIFGYLCIKGLIKRRYFQMFLSAAVIVSIYKEELCLEKLSGWMIFIIAILLAAGFSLVFKNESFIGINIDSTHSDTIAAKNGKIHIENNFGKVTRYITEQELCSIHIENNFGNTVVYLTNAGIKEHYANLNVENSFGQTQLYIPPHFKVVLKQDNVFANTYIVGQCSTDEDAPVLYINVENAFGNVNIFVE